MQANSQTTSKIFTPKPTRPVQHITFQKFTRFPSPLEEISSGKNSALSDFVEDLSEIRRDSQNPQERDDSFQIQCKECSMDKELLALEAEIEEMLNFEQN